MLDEMFRYLNASSIINPISAKFVRQSVISFLMELKATEYGGIINENVLSHFFFNFCFICKVLANGEN